MHSPDPSAPITATPEATRFAIAFAEAWSAPTPERLASLLTDDVVLAQPLFPTSYGKVEAEESFARIFELIPDLHAIVTRHWGDDEIVTIAFELVGTLGGREIRWPLIDIFELRDGLGVRRDSYFDPAALVLAVLTRPRAWLPYLRSGLWRRPAVSGAKVPAPLPPRE